MGIISLNQLEKPWEPSVVNSPLSNGESFQSGGGRGRRSCLGGGLFTPPGPESPTWLLGSVLVIVTSDQIQVDS